MHSLPEGVKEESADFVNYSLTRDAHETLTFDKVLVTDEPVMPLTYHNFSTTY